MFAQPLRLAGGVTLEGLDGLPLRLVDLFECLDPVVCRGKVSLESGHPLPEGSSHVGDDALRAFMLATHVGQTFLKCMCATGDLTGNHLISGCSPLLNLVFSEAL